MGTKPTIPKKQHALFQRLLFRIWEKSPFYRDYYSCHGIKEKDLPDLTVTDLPIISKKNLIDNFDRAVTDPRLNKKNLEEWLEYQRDPRIRFHDDFVIVHSSGTSGDMGIYAYNINEWRIADAAFATYLPPPENLSSGKTKVAFYIAADGHYGIASMAKTMPSNEYDILIAPILEPMEETVNKMNAFQPHRLTGYPDCIAELADYELQGKLNIHPQRIVVGGDNLTESMTKKINAAWHAPIYDMYAASESKYIAIKKPENEKMLVVEDLNIVEMLDADNREVDYSNEGRVVLTNLFNLTFPIVRYDLGDYVVKGTPFDDSGAASILKISGRVSESLPVALSPGCDDTIPSLLLTTIFAPGVEKYQFVSLRTDYFRVDYVAADNIDQPLKREIQRMLKSKGAIRTTFDVRRVAAIPNDPKTGKLRLVKFGDDVEQPANRHFSDKESTHCYSQPDSRDASSIISYRDENDVTQPIPRHDENQIVEKTRRAANGLFTQVDQKSEPTSKNTDSNISPEMERVLIEKILSGVWCEALGIDHVNNYESFFDHSGDSFAMGQIVARITEIFCISTSFQEFFDTPTVAGMTEIIMRDPGNKLNGAVLDTFLDQLDSLSDDEVIQLLKKAGGH